MTGCHLLVLESSPWLTRRWGRGHFLGPPGPGPLPSTEPTRRGWKTAPHPGRSFCPPVRGLGSTTEDGSHPLDAQRFHCGGRLTTGPVSVSLTSWTRVPDHDDMGLCLAALGRGSQFPTKPRPGDSSTTWARSPSARKSSSYYRCMSATWHVSKAIRQP